MADLTANYVFLPWIRQGAASGIQTTDMTANQAGVVSVTIRLQVNLTADVEHQVRLYGPGDVIGIDPQQVIRTEPRHLARDFEPNYFPAIEFDRPDFPWLFTPAKADTANKLRPWLCLIVVRKQEGVTLRVDRNLLLPVLEIREPAQPDRELPDLSESWAWAHAQVTGAKRDSNSLKAALAGDPALTLSRLLCPRRLDPLTEYLACVVPTFELGRKAGLAIPIQRDEQRDEEKELELAWKLGAPSLAAVTLPVYFHWDFRTGSGGDFESLVGLLKARPMPPEVGKRRLVISDPGFTMKPAAAPDANEMALGLEGALRLVESKPDEWPTAVRLPFQTALQDILETPWKIATKESGDAHDPIVGPPIYGCWQAARHTVEFSPPPPASLTWLDELNLDPRHRTVAGLGTQVVQAQQEELMAAAWEQLGEIQRMNQIRRQAQLGRTVSAIYHARHFTQFSQETLLKVLAPAQSRVVVEAGTPTDKRALLSHKISQSALPARTVSAPLRRFTSPRGVISARFLNAGAPPIAIVAKLNIPTPIVPLLKREAGLVTINQVSDSQSGPIGGLLKQTVSFERISRSLLTTPSLGNFKVVAEGFMPKRSLLSFESGLPDSPDAAMFRKLVKAQQDYLKEIFTPIKPIAPPPMDMSGIDLKAKLLRSVNPEKTIHARVKASLILADGAEAPGDPLEPIMDAPKFPQPMYEALRDLSQDFLLPGLEYVVPDTVSLLEPNPKFVESFLVGLNAEMSSELLWRNYPTDQRGTYFEQFWDTSADKAQSDIEPISNWGERQLGQNMPRASGNLVLLIRGELLRRYPNSVIYAVPAVMINGQLDLSSKPEDEKHPLFRGTLKPDVTFLGFDLTSSKALGEPPNDPNGWFFVIQQQPAEPSFGMDVADFVKQPQPPPLTTWNDLSWRHLVDTEEELKKLSHASIKKVLPDIDKAKWGLSSNSAHHAYITLQRPVRIAIHAKQMLAKTVRSTDAHS
ncbi:MAG: uncharacterized protein JWM21_2230 [Acidobacteria bacterium]|nr:uncharacterized protein [Acidobacteriota bacterium]